MFTLVAFIHAIKSRTIMIKKGIAGAFKKFDAYQFAKYRRSDKDVKLRDALFLTHPKPENEERAALYKKIAEDTLESADTWEVRVSTKGASKDSWEKSIPRMGYMALLRNLANFSKHEINRALLEQVCNTLTDPQRVKVSKQLPFRFLSNRNFC